MGCAELTEQERVLFESIAAQIGAARQIAICGHTDPDGDAFGSNLALAMVIERRWPGAQVRTLLADDAPIPAAYAAMPGADRLERASGYDVVPDLFISVDTPTPERLNLARPVLERAADTVAIDHHPTMQQFARTSLVRASAASTGDIVYDFMSFLGVEPTREIATCILMAILTDTGRYQYQNTDAHALRASADMIDAGASPAQIATWVYQSDTISAMHLKALAMERLRLDATGQIALSYVMQEDLGCLGACPSDCDGLIDVVRAVGGVQGCAFFRERPDGTVRANLRSKGDLDVCSVARTFGGGGHRAAAGLTVDGPMEQAIERVIAALVDELARQGA